ncbi:MAG: hypothetical protein AAF804_06825, partial [Bacteroidota bacterium]
MNRPAHVSWIPSAFRPGSCWGLITAGGKASPEYCGVAQVLRLNGFEVLEIDPRSLRRAGSPVYRHLTDLHCTPAGLMIPADNPNVNGWLEGSHILQIEQAWVWGEAATEADRPSWLVQVQPPGPRIYLGGDPLTALECLKKSRRPFKSPLSNA